MLGIGRLAGTKWAGLFLLFAVLAASVAAAPSGASMAVQAAPQAAQGGAPAATPAQADAKAQTPPGPGDASDQAAPGDDGVARLEKALGESAEYIDGGSPEEAVVFNYENRDIAPLRVRLFGRRPAQRAEATTHLLDRLVEAQTISPVVGRRIPGGALIFVTDIGVLGLADADLAGWGSETMDQAVAGIAHNLDLALREAVEARSPHQLLMGLVWAVVATVLLALLLRGLIALAVYLAAWLARLDAAESARMAGRPADLTSFSAHWLRTALLRLARLLTLGAGLMGLWAWLTFTLLQFPYLRPVGESLDDNLKHLVLSALDSTLGAIPDLIVAALILLAARFVVRACNGFFDAVSAGRVSVVWIDRDVALATRKVVSFALWAFAIVLAYPYLPGSDTEAFKGVTVFLGLLFSLGATGTVGQAVSGLMLMYSRIVKVGDYVRIGPSEGTVTQINLLATRLRTVFDEELVIPNSVVMGQTTQNFSRFKDAGGVRLTTEVTIGYDAPWRQVHALLLRAAALTPGVRAHPAPEVLQTELSDFYVRYRLTACVEVPDYRIPVLSALHRNIQDQFNEHGVQIMSPHFLANPPHPVVVPKERWNTAPADPAAG